jgi:hypothetical protein
LSPHQLTNGQTSPYLPLTRPRTLLRTRTGRLQPQSFLHFASSSRGEWALQSRRVRGVSRVVGRWVRIGVGSVS